MVKLSSVFKLIVLSFIIVMLGYFNIIESLNIKGNLFLIRIIFVIIGILMALFVIHNKKNNEGLKSHCKILSKYMRIYILVILISSIYTILAYNYTLRELLNALIPFLYVFYAYPLVYIFCMDGDYEKFIKKILVLVIGILLIKTICWYLYNFKGITLFPDLLFQYDGWFRDGMQRLDPGYLFGVSLCFVLCKLFQGKNKLIYGIISISLFLFLILVTQYRFQIIVSAIVFAMIYYTAGILNKKKSVRFLILSSIFILFVAFGGLNSIFSSFAVNGEYGGSTSARLLNIAHYWNLMVDRGAVVGLGLLDAINATAADIMTYGPFSNQYWLADIGILGGVVRFGIMAVVVYGYLFYLAIKCCLNNIKLRTIQNKRSILFLMGISCYMIFICLGLNIFDSQRAFDVPFYLAIISFINSESCKDKLQGVKEKI